MNNLCATKKVLTRKFLTRKVITLKNSGPDSLPEAWGIEILALDRVVRLGQGRVGLV